MPLPPGFQLGPYEIIEKLGEGGMGEVYRAHDAKLRRDVAVKILPDLFATDPERVARLLREAQALAALNHPNIAHIYGVENVRGTHALVMELVDGEDLSHRIARGPVPLDEALPIARQLADALEAAHDHGIVHRDLKPANIKIAADGTVKVLDFGLAKAAEPTVAGPVNVANSPTFTAHATQMGVVLGTAAYMAPEQARGKVVDRRADVWAFGAVLYEMLTGRRAFDGDDASEILASVLKSEPGWAAIPADAPPSIRRLLRRCLEKDPRRRLSAIGDARLELEERDAVAAPAAIAPPPARPSRFNYVASALAGALVASLAAALVWNRLAPRANPATTRLSILSPAGEEELYPDSTGVTISPDGRKVAFIVGGNVIQSGAGQLWVRSLDTLEAHRVDGADGAQLPFWAPDGRRLGFFANSKLETVDAAGGRVQVLCDAPDEGRGAVWTPSNDIIFAPSASGPLYRISGNGGSLNTLTKLDPSKEFGHRFPTLLADGDHFLYASLPSHDGLFDIYASSLSNPAARTLVGAMESAPVYADPGWLLFARQGVLTAQRFDRTALKLVGEPIPLEDAPSAILDPRFSYTAGRIVSAAANGTLAYFTLPSNNITAAWMDAAGQITGKLDIPPGHYDAATISPDGTHAVLVRSTSPSQSSLWLTDLARGGAVPLTTGRGRNDSPVWSPDGSRVVFTSDRSGADDFYVKDIADSAPERLLYHSPVLFENPESWSPDGQTIVMTVLSAQTAQDVWLLDLHGGPKASPLVVGPRKDVGGIVSPDGHSMIYASDDTGRVQLFVTTFPHPGLRVQVSNGGALIGWWSPDNRQILYVSDDARTLWRADVQAGTTMRVSAPVKLATLPPNVNSLAAMPDRRTFLVLMPERAGEGSITVVQNWLAAVGGR